MWRTTLSIALVLGVAAPAMAIGKFDIRAQNCASVHAILGRDRQAILRFPSRDGRVTLYDRYVSTLPNAALVNMAFAPLSRQPTALAPS